MRREGTPAWMQVVDGVGNRPSRMPVAARTRPRQAGGSTRIHAGEGAQGIARTQVMSFGGPSVCREEILI